MQKPRQASAKKWLPRSRTGRIIVGGAFVAGGIVGFLPLVGFWMIPIGIGILSADVPAVRRLARNAKVRLGRWRQKRRRADPT